jgi:hypothetical protein
MRMWILVEVVLCCSNIFKLWLGGQSEAKFKQKGKRLAEGGR